MKRLILTILFKVIGFIFILFVIYLATLYAFPQIFFKYKITVGNVTMYANEPIPKITKARIDGANVRLKKSAIYKEGIRYKVFIVNNPVLWRYFSNRNNGAAALNYVGVNNIFFRKADIVNNKVYGNKSAARGDRTFEYFLAHEMTHSLEFYSMAWYKYPLNTNWALEGYSEYIAHESETYEQALSRYLTLPENTGEKYYTRARTMVAYLLEKEKIEVRDLWSKSGDYDIVLKKAIPYDKPKLETNK